MPKVIEAVQCLKMYTDKMVSYLRVFWDEPPSHSPPEFKRPRSVISEKAGRNIRKYIDFIDSTSETKHLYCKEDKHFYTYRLSFLTLTLSASQLTPFGQDLFSNICKNKYCLSGFNSVKKAFRYTDTQIKHDLINQFITELRDRYYVKVYMWKAETQENGNIHFHFILNEFIWYRYMLNIWNRIQNKYGFVDEFSKKFGHRNPNSIDIHSIRSIRNTKKYFTKYLMKSNEHRRPVVGKIWAVSANVSNYDGITIMIGSDDLPEFEQFYNLFKGRIYSEAYFTCYNVCPIEIEYHIPNSFIGKQFREKMLSTYGITVAPIHECIQSNSSN